MAQQGGPDGCTLGCHHSWATASVFIQRVGTNVLPPPLWRRSRRSYCVGTCAVTISRPQLHRADQPNISGFDVLSSTLSALSALAPHGEVPLPTAKSSWAGRTRHWPKATLALATSQLLRLPPPRPHHWHRLRIMTHDKTKNGRRRLRQQLLKLSSTVDTQRRQRRHVEDKRRQHDDGNDDRRRRQRTNSNCCYGNCCYFRFYLTSTTTSNTNSYNNLL